MLGGMFYALYQSAIMMYKRVWCVCAISLSLDLACVLRMRVRVWFVCMFVCVCKHIPHAFSLCNQQTAMAPIDYSTTTPAYRVESSRRPCFSWKQPQQQQLLMLLLTSTCCVKKKQS